MMTSSRTLYDGVSQDDSEDPRIGPLYVSTSRHDAVPRNHDGVRCSVVVFAVALLIGLGVAIALPIIYTHKSTGVDTKTDMSKSQTLTSIQTEVGDQTAQKIEDNSEQENSEPQSSRNSTYTGFNSWYKGNKDDETEKEVNSEDDYESDEYYYGDDDEDIPKIIQSINFANSDNDDDDTKDDNANEEVGNEKEQGETYLENGESDSSSYETHESQAPAPSVNSSSNASVVGKQVLNNSTGNYSSINSSQINVTQIKNDTDGNGDDEENAINNSTQVGSTTYSDWVYSDDHHLSSNMAALIAACTVLGISLLLFGISCLLRKKTKKNRRVTIKNMVTDLQAPDKVILLNEDTSEDEIAH